ncbi:MAG: HAMP domain-containing sensor histidine kinase, partial [Burkholderiaceae bacterium]
LHFGENPDAQQVMLVQVARSSANREELTRRLLLDTVLPLSALIVMMSMIVWAGVSAGLAPLMRLRNLVEGRAPNDLRPIELDAAPQELRSLAQAINELLEAVQNTVQSQRRFISDAAHQLRTPLAGLKSQTELALSEAADPQRQRGVPLLTRLQRVQESATRSAHLVNQLLALARTEPESVTSQPLRRLDLARLAREATAELVPRALQRGVDLGYEPLDDQSIDGARPVWVSGIALLLSEAIVNLVDNALRYAGPQAAVTVQVGQRDGRAELWVSDNGPGIAEDLRAKVFERFFRATHEGNGCGLGLAIVKEIVERHGGQVSLGPLQPQGLRVRVSLPLAPA